MTDRRDGDDQETRQLLVDALQTIERLQERLGDRGGRLDEPIAVVGMSCRFPSGADSPEEYWDLLRHGVDATAEFPADRADASAVYDADPEKPGKAYTVRGGFLRRIDGFEPEVFGISPREAVGMDPQQRVALEISWEALERAGRAPDGLAGTRTGVFLGLSTTDYVRLRQQVGDIADVDAYQLIGEPSFTAGRISYVLGLRGPSKCVDTSCSSSLVAVHDACQSLRLRECDLALAGGVNMLIAPYGFVIMSKFRALAADGRCKTFDAAADGYARGEGAGVVVLKRLADAVADGDNVVAVIRGSAVNHDGRSSGLTVPNAEAQQDVIRAALTMAGLPGTAVDYVEAHGTGTALGDPIELRALDAVLCRDRRKDAPLLVGSVKTNIGHLEPAAGIAGLVKLILAIEHGEVPPHLHLDNPNPNVDWDALRVEVPREHRGWPTGGNGARVGAVSSFGASGTNAHAVVTSPPAATPRKTSSERPGLLLLSTRTEPALEELARRQVAWLRRADDDDVADACFTTHVGRAVQRHGLAVVGSSADRLAEQLEGWLDTDRPAKARSAAVTLQPYRHRKLAWLFTGQGSQYPGMGSDLRAEPAFAAAFAECEELFHAVSGERLSEVVWPGERTSPARLDDTGYTQPALFTLEYSLARLLQAWGLRPSALAGHSVGELVAACLAGVLDLTDAVTVVAARARLMSALPEGGAMAAVRCDERTATHALERSGGTVAVAAVNGPADVVLSGAERDLAAVLDTLRADGVPAHRLATSHAFHSPLMEPMLSDFRTVLDSVTFHPPRVPLMSNVTGTWWTERELDPDYWVRHAVRPVRFADGLARMYGDGFRTFVELGPTPVLSTMGARCVSDPDAEFVPLLRKGTDDTSTVLGAVGRLRLRGADVDWTAFHGGEDVRRIELPTTPWQGESYWFKEARPAVAEPVPPPAADESCYRVDWTIVAPEQPMRDLSGIHYLLVQDSQGTAVEVAAELRARGADVTLAWPRITGTASECVVDVAETGRVVESFVESAARPARIVVSSGLDAPIPDHCDAWMLDEHAARADLTALAIVAELTRRDCHDVTVTLLTRGAVRAVDGDDVNPTATTLWGLAGVLALEHPAHWAGIVDLAPEPAADEAARLVDVLSARQPEDQLAVRSDATFAPRLEKRTAGTVERREPPVRDDGSYLVTGGFGGIGVEVARWLARSGAGRLVLLSRTPLPDREDWDADQPEVVRARVDTVRELERLGADVEVVAADVADEAAMIDVFSALQDAAQPLRGVVHAAGVSDPQLVLDVTPDAYRRVWRPKVVGGSLLHQLVPATLDFFVGLSSIAATWGSQHLASYAAGNAFLAGLAHHRARNGSPATVVDWGPWAVRSGLFDDEVAQYLRATGLRPLSATYCLELLGGMLADTRPHHVVCDADWSRYKPIMEARGPRPLLAGMAVDESDTARSSTGTRYLAAVRSAGSSDEVTEILTGYLVDVVAEATGTRPDAVDPAVETADHGIDSLVVMDVVKRCRADLGLTLSVRDILARSTLVDWADLMATELDEATGERSPAGGGDDTGRPGPLDARWISTDVDLDPAIRPHDRSTRTARPQHVLLTGATGFVGAYVLDELLEATQADVWCLVRCADEHEGLTRIRTNTEKYLRWREDAAERIRILPGDLARPSLGLAGSVRTELADRLDGIYHCGAWVNFGHSYEQMRAANIEGTHELVRLAASGRAVLHHVSTYGIWGLPTGGRTVIGEDEPLATAGTLVTGYVQTKWGAERLVEIARKRGVAADVYRPGRVLGDSRTGACLPTHFTTRMIKGCIQLGVAPELDLAVEMTPVDYVAAALVRISLAGPPPGRTYHLVNTTKLKWSQLLTIVRRRGFELPTVPVEEWWSRLRQDYADGDNVLHPVMEVVQAFVVDGEEAIDYDTTNTDAALEGTGIACPPLDEQLTNIYLDWLIETGYLRSRDA